MEENIFARMEGTMPVGPDEEAQENILTPEESDDDAGMQAQDPEPDAAAEAAESAGADETDESGTAEDGSQIQAKPDGEPEEAAEAAEKPKRRRKTKEAPADGGAVRDNAAEDGPVAGTAPENGRAGFDSASIVEKMKKMAEETEYAPEEEPVQEADPADSAARYADNPFGDSEAAYAGARTARFVDDRMKKEYADTSAEDRKREHWQNVLAYKARKTIIESVVVAAEQTQTGHTHIMTTVEDFNVTIPDTAYFDMDAFKADYFEADRDEQDRRRYEMARARIGSKVSFIIVGARRHEDPETGEIYYVVAGSRTDAMKAKQQKFFYGTRPVTAGMCADARVLSVGENVVTCEVLGTECYINSMELDLLSYVADCRKHTAPGDVVRVYINKIHYNTDKDGRPAGVKLNVSAAAMQQTEFASNMEKVNVGSSYLGTVRSYRSDKGVYTVALDRKALVAVSPDFVVGGETLIRGDRVVVTIKRKYGTYAVGSAKKLNARV